MSKRTVIVRDIITFAALVLVAGGLLRLVLGVAQLANPDFARTLTPFALGAGVMLGLTLLAVLVLLGAYVRNRGIPARNRFVAILLVAVPLLVAALVYRGC